MIECVHVDDYYWWPLVDIIYPQFMIDIYIWTVSTQKRKQLKL